MNTAGFFRRYRKTSPAGARIAPSAKGRYAFEIVNPVRYGISTKFTAFITVTVVLFLTVVFLAGFTLLRRYSIEDAGELASTILDETSTKINRFFSEVEHLARGLAGYRAVYEVDVDHMKDLFISTVLARRQYLRAIYLGTEDGRMYEWGYGKGFDEYTPRLPPGYDPRIRPWYRAGLQSGDFTISAPYIYASVEALGITGVMPVTTREGTLVGILGIDILLEDLQSLLASLEIPKNGRAILLNEKGEIIASQYSAPSRGGLTLETFQARNAAQLLATGAGSFVSAMEGRKTYFSYKINDQTGWILLVGLPYDSIMESVGRVLTMMAIVDALLMILLVIALSLITQRVILHPLGDIIAVINRLEGGEKQARLRVSSGDEFGILGDELNKLADTVEEYSTRLEEKVRQRTEEIARLEQENTRLRIVEEKERIYRDLHDSLGARLTNIAICNTVALKLAGGKAARALIAENRKLHDMLERIETNCRQAIVNLKEIVLGMAVDRQTASDFVKITELGIRRRLNPQRISLRSSVDGPEAINRLDERLKSEMQKVLLELVSNVLKHARASRVSLKLARGDGAVSLVFSDNGTGFDYRAAKKKGYGLRSIQHRVEGLGGSLAVASRPKGGTTYTILIPVEAEPDERGL
jgi:methyl-accepting chemotaxis protein